MRVYTRATARELVREALSSQPLRRLQLAWGLVSTGTWSFTIILAVYAYGEGGAAAVGVAAFTRMLPAAFAAPVAGLLADQRSRRDVLVILAVARAAVLALAAATIAVGAPFAALLVPAALFTMLSTGHKPAQAGLLITLATTPKQLAAANALWSAGDNGGFLLGSLLGGVLVGMAAPDTAMAATAAMFALSALALAAVDRDPVPAHREAFPGATAKREVALGLRAVAGNRGLRTVVALSAATTTVHGAVDVLVVVLALDILLIGESGVGWLSAAWGAGGLVGGAAALLLVGRGRLAVGVVAGTFVVGLPLCALSLAPSTAFAIAALMAVGVGSSVIETGVLTFMQRLTTDEVLARVFAVHESGLQLTTGLGAVAAPVVISALGQGGALVATGLLLPLLALLLRGALSRLEAGSEVSPERLALVRGLHLFAPLAPILQERLAARLHPLTIAAGNAVIREGEPGDTFYILVAGSAEVIRNGTVVGRVQSGEGFGEIALVRDVPRTATVTAATDLELLTLDRGSFLSAVAGQRRSRAAAERLIRQRMPEMAAGDA